MIEGVVCANELPPHDAARVRNELWQATEDIDTRAATAAGSPELPLPEPGEVPQAA